MRNPRICAGSDWIIQVESFIAKLKNRWNVDTLCFPGLKKTIYIPFIPREELDPEEVMRFIEDVLQSNEDFGLDDALTVQATVIAAPGGAGPTKGKARFNLDVWLRARKNGHGSVLIEINNNDNLCLARAVETGIARLRRGDSDAARREYDNVVRGDKVWWGHSFKIEKIWIHKIEM
jgi:hypothetical protein